MPRGNAPVAQLDRAPDYESGGQEFESLRARQSTILHDIVAGKRTNGANVPGRPCVASGLSRRCRLAMLPFDLQRTKMSEKAKMLTDQARALPPQDRIALIEDLLDSLDRADPNVDQLWAREANDRLAAYRRGELRARDLREIIAKYRP